MSEKTIAPTLFVLRAPPPGRVSLRIFTGFLIILCSVILWLLPVSESIYTWKTDPRTDTFSITTGAAVTSANEVLQKTIYDGDISTVVFASDIEEVPAAVSYNSTTRLLSFDGLTADTDRSLEITYDISAFPNAPVLDTIGDIAPWLVYIILVLFPLAGIVFIFWEKWFGD